MLDLDKYINEIVKGLKDVDSKLQRQNINFSKEIVNVVYTRIESLLWLQKRLAIQGQLPPLSGWPAGPDFLLRLHTWVCKKKPKLVVETGSGVTTLVIADALRQNGNGKLISFEHLQEYADKTYETLREEELLCWVDLRVGALEEWHGEHLNPADAKKKSRWYPLNLEGISNAELLVVDGPPGNTCLYSRYPALPAFFGCLAPTAEVWMDDANRKEEKDISEAWAERYGFEMELIPLEKGMSRLWRAPSIYNELTNANAERKLCLDFTMPEKR
ncbi:class I SAM-dependent methyltransferase [Vreelandella zhanjiangensis]|uniref:class I SAM-dependent methyltransferase n=1 Tax=Vreelandella zhanjiangensis TaxID=1121960 RepID=UPI00402AA587